LVHTGGTLLSEIPYKFELKCTSGSLRAAQTSALPEHRKLPGTVMTGFIDEWFCVVAYKVGVCSCSLQGKKQKFW